MAKTEYTECPRCNGTGRIAEYGHIRNGLCFKCSGSGQVRKSRPQSAAAKAKAQAKRQAKEQARAQHIAEYTRKAEIAMEMYQDDPRMRVTADHPYYQQHAVELAQYYKTWATL